MVRTKTVEKYSNFNQSSLETVVTNIYFLSSETNPSQWSVRFHFSTMSLSVQSCPFFPEVMCFRISNILSIGLQQIGQWW